MTMNEQDDNIVGQALRRAVESQPVRETPFHQSRLAAELERPPMRFGLWQFAAAAAALVLAAGAGLYLANLRPQEGGVAQSPTPTPASPTPQATPLPGRLDRQVVYFARDRLAPRAQHVDGAGVANTTEERIKSRLQALQTATARSGEVNVVGDSKAVVASVRVAGDTATVDYSVPADDWGVSGSASVRGLVQQIVYTASEEPGIRQVLITQNGGKQAVIGGEGLIVDRPQTREAIFGYAQPGSAQRLDNPAGRAMSGTSTFAEDVERTVPGLTRIAIAFSNPPTDDIARYTATVRQNDESRDPDRAKWVLSLEIPGVRGSTANMEQIAADTWFQRIDQTPLRAVYLVQAGSTTRYEFALDDLRPWRVVLLDRQSRLGVDIGGYPDAVRGDTAVYAPVPGSAVSRTFTLSGAARAHEANVTWRVKNASGQVVQRGFATANIGTNPTWGSFSTSVTVPSSVSGAVTIEVYQVSPRDGSEMHLVSYGVALR